MRVFVAGATGAVGRRLVPLLMAEGLEVTAIGRSLEKRAWLARAGATPVEVSLFDREALTRAVSGHQAVINVATGMPPTQLLSRSLRISNRKLRQETGWAPSFPSVREGWPAVIRLLRGD
jgi:uncharacterized protein YbjT (DUF2867 family)